MKIKITDTKNIEIDGKKYTLTDSLTQSEILTALRQGVLKTTVGNIIVNQNNLVVKKGAKTFEVNGESLTLDLEVDEETLLRDLRKDSFVKLSDNSFYRLDNGGGTSGGGTTSRSYKSLLKYYLTKEALLEGSELTEADASVPDRTGNKGFLTSASESTLLSFYEAFDYNEDNFNLILGLGDDVEVSFLCSDRRYGVAGSRRAWSPYFKISELISQSFIDIQNVLVGSDTSPEYFVKAKITLNGNGTLFITLIDGHSGVNLYGSVLNIRHRVSS